jgi:nucleotide-binding universal stress UspA family protein
MYDRILLPVDGSEPSTAATDHALDLAATYGATVHAIYVVDDDALRAARIDSDIIIERFESEGHTLVGEVVDAGDDHGVDVETAVVHGRPEKAIVEYVDDHDVDLIVMGTHGRGGVERLLLGSVTERVVRTSPVPVLTVHGGVADEPADDE